jgi:two-component system, cell cycle sensor histidine kinase and response regulator CckA
MDVRSKDGSMVKVRMTGTRSESEGQSDFYMFFETSASATAPASAPAQPPLALVERVVGRITAKFEELFTVISGYGELALHGAPQESPLRQHLEEIVAASEQASHLARNLLAFSGSQLIPLEPVDLNAVVQDAAKEIPELVNLDLAADAPLALANRECLRQVVQLLAESAGFRMAGKSGGIRVHTSRCALDRPRVLYSGEAPAGSYGVITVSDSGTPLDAEVLAHLFEPLYLNPTILGVDLSPIYGIVTSLGGRLHVESDDAHGTTFEIWLPFGAEQAGREQPRSRGAVANG